MTARHNGRQQNIERIGAFCRAAGVESHWTAARIHAERILAEYGRTTPPFDAWELCALRRIEIQTAYLDGCDARLLPVRGGYIAEVHSEDRRERQSFSLCHELGHTLFDEASAANAECSLSAYGCEDRLEERLCEFIASEVLMPRNIFVEHVAGREATWTQLCEVARIFQVSKEAAINRIVDLDIWPCVDIRLRRIITTEKPERFALEWFQPSRSLGRNPVGTAFLVLRIMDCLHSGGSQAFTRGNCYEVDLGLSTPLLLSGRRFEVGDTRFAQLLAVMLRPQAAIEADRFAASEGQLSLFAS